MFSKCNSIVPVGNKKSEIHNGIMHFHGHRHLLHNMHVITSERSSEINGMLRCNLECK